MSEDAMDSGAASTAGNGGSAERGVEEQRLEERGLEERGLEEQLDAALAAAPEFTLSADFAARVMAALPPETKMTAVPSRYGRTAALWCGALLAGMLLLLMVGGATTEPRWLLSILSLELVLVAMIGGPWRRVLRWPA